MTLAGALGDDVGGGGVPETTPEASMPGENRTGRFKCEQCSKSFKSMTRLRNHTRTHPVSFSDIQDSLAFLAQHDITQRLETQMAVEITAQDDVPKSDTATVQAINSLSSRQMSPAKSSATRANSRRRSGIPLPQSRLVSASLKAPRRSLQITEADSLRQYTNKYTADNVCTNPTADKLNKTLPVSANTPRTRQPNSRKSIGTGLRRTPAMSKDATANVEGTPAKTPSRVNMVKRQSIGGFNKHTKTTMSPAINSKDSVPAPLEIKKSTKATTCTPTKTTTPNRSRAKVRVISAPKNRTASNKRTPKNGKGTPRGNKSTPKNNTGTPVDTQRNTPKGNQHKCNRCGKGFLSQRLLDIHYVMHVRDTPKACGIPSEVIKKKPRRLQMTGQTAVTNSPDVDTRIYSCDKCSRVYQNERYLQAHMKTHTLDTPYVCDICQKRFKFLSSLKSHKITHIGEKTHRDALNSIAKGDKYERRRSSQAYEEECDALNLIGAVRNSFSVCGADDLEKDTLSDVFEETPYECKSCDFKTSQPVALLTHMKTHSARRPYTCEKCHKSYNTKSNLDVHSKVHVIEKLRHVLAERRRVWKI